MVSHAKCYYLDFCDFAQVVFFEEEKNEIEYV